jgi:hypothetical protein
MSRWLFVSIPLLVILIGVSPAFAKDIYFAPTSAGGNNGTDCADAYAYSDATYGWNQSSQQSAGNNLHVCSGTYTFAKGATILTSVNSGSSGSPITFIADQGVATFQAPYFSASGAIVIGNSYWTINGANNLTIQNTLNGTPGGSCIGGSCSYQQASRFIALNCTTCNVEIKQLTLADDYVHTAGSADGTGQPGNIGIIFLGSSNVTLDYITCHDSWTCFNGWGNNILAYNNTLYNCAAGWWFGSNAPTSSLVVHDNWFHDTGLWWTAADDFHLEDFHIFANSGSGSVSGLQVYNNHFGPENNSHYSTGAQTAHFFNEGPSVSPEIFNNLFDNGTTDFMPPIEISTSTGGSFTVSNALIVNNTFLGGYTGGGTGDENVILDSGVKGLTFENNVVTAGAGLVNQPGVFASGGLNQNAYDNGTSAPYAYQGNNEGSLTAWQSATGQDAASLYASIATLKVNSDGTLASGSPAIGLAVNLSSLGITALNSDKNGNPRPSSGAWDAGAYNGSSGALSPPTKLQAAVH